MARASSTIVLGAAVGYTLAQMAPFLTSLRNAGYAGDVALIVERARVAEFSRLPLFRGVCLLPASQWIPWRFPLLKNNPRVQRWLWHPLQTALWGAMRLLGLLPLPADLRLRLQILLAQHLYPPTESRFLRYLAFLLSHPYKRVLLTDVRDVLFQSDPFTALPATGLAVSMEVHDYTIGTEKWNSSRVRLIFGDAVLRRVGDQTVSCSGFTAGDRDSIIHYLRLMAREIFALTRQAARQGWFDQAIHNVVLYAYWTGELHKLETLASPVATLGAVAEGVVILDASGRVLNHDDSLAAVLHQYDRLQGLRARLRQTLAPGCDSE